MDLSPYHLVGRDEVGHQDKVLVAFSGGPDSMALVHLLLQAQKEKAFGLQTLHFDHGLRPTSGQEAAWVQAHCHDIGLPCHVEKLEVEAYAKATGLGIEGAGHQLRKNRLLSYARAQGCRHIALGHHGDDQAETFLLNSIRGSGLAGLTAMEVRNGPFWRPLLHVRKEDLVAYCRAQGLSYIEDESNAGRAYARNTLRHEVLPVLEKLNPKAIDHIGQAIRLLQEDRVLLEALTNQTFQALADRREGEVVFLMSDLQTLSWPLVRRVLIQAAASLLPGKSLTQAHFAHIFSYYQGKTYGQTDLGGGLSLWCQGQVLSLSLHRQGEPDHTPLLWTMEAPVDFGQDYHFSIEPKAFCGVADKTGLWLPEPRPLLIRTRRPGDRIALAGLGHKEVKDLFRTHRVHPKSRWTWPLLCDPGTGKILWIPGLAISQEVRREPFQEKGILIKMGKRAGFSKLEGENR